MSPEAQSLQTQWWALTFRGIIAIIFGIAAVFWPGITLLTLIYLFSAWILIDGVIRIVTGIGRIGSHRLGFLTAVIGLIELGVGVYLLRHPAVPFATLILLISFTLIIDGIIAVVSSFSDDQDGGAKALTIIIGVAAVLAGIILLFQPVASGVAFVWILGLYALISGPLLIAMSIELHKLSKTLNNGKRK